MGFRDLCLLDVYRTGKQDLLNDFYIPALSETKNYSRAVGFFSASLLAYALKGVSSIVKKDGVMKLIIGHPLSEEEYGALQEGYSEKYIAEILGAELDEIMAAESPVEKYRLRIFSLMICTGKLEIKFALRRKGMYHEKIGILEDNLGDKLLFTGSANETTNAINPDLNYESITVYKSWEKDNYKRFAHEFECGFSDIWNGLDGAIKTIDMPSSLYEKISKNYLQSPAIFVDENESKLMDEYFEEHNSNYPIIPKYINDKKFSVFDHQESALKSWFAHGGRGLLMLATGSGKTVTAMYGVSKIFEMATRPRKILFIVAVPYVALADQWVSELSIFNINPVSCYGGRKNWEDRLNSRISNLISGVIEFSAIVVVNKTLCSDAFQKSISRISGSSIFFVGDECHRHGTQLMSAALPNAVYRMGLSATPYIETLEVDGVDAEEVEDEAKDILTSYYGNIVAKYEMNDALADGVLTPYKYHLIKVELTLEETDMYVSFSKEIGRLMAIDKSKNNIALQNAIRKRNKLVANANNKLAILGALLKSEDFHDKSHTLFYVGEGSASSDDDDDGMQLDSSTQLQKVSEIVRNNGWKISKFTAKESRIDRLSIMNSFKAGDIDGLVSMRVLDEGIDIPECKRAFILASSRNSRQFIQRRGRILRRSVGKEYADIYDFLVTGRSGVADPSLKGMVRKELARAMDFIRLSDNRMEVEVTAKGIADEYDVDLLGV